MKRFFLKYLFIAFTSFVAHAQDLNSTTLVGKDEICTYPNTGSFSAYPDLSNAGVKYKWLLADKIVGKKSTYTLSTPIESTFELKLIAYSSTDTVERVKSIQVNRTPLPLLNGADTTICGIADIQVSVSEKYNMNYLKAAWYNEEGLLEFDGDEIHVDYGENYSVILENAKCSSVEEFTNITYVSLQVDSVAASSTSIFEGDNVTFMAFLNGDVNYFEYEWIELNDTSVIATGNQFIISPKSTNSYLFKATNETYGCEYTSTPFIVEVQEASRISEIFTPNGDGINDQWIIEGLEFATEARINIFGRWGTPVFEHVGSYYDEFDGTFNGDIIPPGVYYYIIDAGNGTVFNGNLTILR